MLTPIIEDIARLVAGFRTALLVIVVAALMLWIGRCTAAHDAVIQERVKVLTREIRVTDTLYRTDTVTAYRTRIRYDSTQIRDTVMRHDSVFVYKPLADTAIHACTQALRDCDHLRLLNDSLSKQLVKQKPGFWSRVGCNVGPSLLAKRDGTVVAGVGATCGFKVWP